MKEKNKITTQQIVTRDNWRVKNYNKSLRGYQTRKDILENMFLAINFEKISNKDKIIIADIGCGPGICGEYFAKKIKEKLKDKNKLKIFFIDINGQMLEQIPSKKGYSKIIGDIVSIPMKKESIDILIVKQVLDYLPKDLQMKALLEINRVLKIDGEFILSALISPHKKINNLTNYFYSEREKIIAKKVAIEKFIFDEEILLKWLQKVGFSKKEVLYKYNIPLSTEDFKESFNLTKRQQEKLKMLYSKVVTQDKNNNFKSKKIIGNDLELTERGIIIKAEK